MGLMLRELLSESLSLKTTKRTHFQRKCLQQMREHVYGCRLEEFKTLDE